MSGSRGKETCVQVEMGVRHPSGAFSRNIFKETKDISSIRKKYKNRGVYLSAYAYDNVRDKDNSLLYGHLYVDLDITDLKDVNKENEAFEKIREDGIKTISFLSAICHVDEEMIKIYYSGQKGLHIIVPARILGVQPMQELNMVYKLIAEEIHKFSKHKTIDTQIYDNARLFSLPNVIHPETGRYKIPLTFQELRTLSFQTIKKLSQKKRKVQYKEPRYNTRTSRIFQTYITDWEKQKKENAKKNGKGGTKKLDFCPPCIKSMLERPCPSGFRNNTAAALCSYFRLRGMSEKKAWKKLETWNEEYANLSQRELDTTFKSIFKADYEYGCGRLEQLGICDKQNCKIGRSIENKGKQGDKK